jgi:hypothetical protein
LLPPVGELQNQIAAAERRDQAVIEMLYSFTNPATSMEDLLAEYVENLRVQLTWRINRKSPPRCLGCGNADILPMTYRRTRSGNEKWTLTPHEDCGGTLTVLKEAMVLSRGGICYDTEGRAIQRDF